MGPLLLTFKFTFPGVVDYIFSVDFILFYIIAVGIGGVCSSPCYLFLWWCYSLLIMTDMPVWLTKLLLATTSVLCCITIFIMLSLLDLTNFWSRGSVIFIGAYSLPLIVGIFIYKVKTKPDPISNNKL